MSNEVGSMDVVMNYKDGGFQSGMEKTKQWLSDAKGAGKSLNTEFTRLKAGALAVGAVAAGVAKKLSGMLVGALSDSPYLIGALTRIKTSFQMIGWEISKVLKPPLDWLADKISDLKDWFLGLNEGTQDFISWIVILGVAAGTTVLAIGGLALALAGLGLPGLLIALKGVATWIGTAGAAFVTSTVGIVALGTALGTIVGFLGVIALDELGVLDWIADLGTKLRETEGWVGSLTKAFEKLLLPVAIIGDVVLGASGVKDWGDVRSDIWNGLNMDDWATGTMVVPSDGKYGLKAGEKVVPAGTSGNSGGSGGLVNIVVDFGNSVFNMASGIDIEDLADSVSKAIAEKQAWEAY